MFERQGSRLPPNISLDFVYLSKKRVSSKHPQDHLEKCHFMGIYFLILVTPIHLTHLQDISIERQKKKKDSMVWDLFSAGLIYLTIIIHNVNLVWKDMSQVILTSFSIWTNYHN